MGSLGSIHKINYRGETISPAISYTFDFIFEMLGMANSLTHDNDYHIYYGNSPEANMDKLIIRRNEKDVLWNNLLNQSDALGKIGNVIPFDLVNAIYMFISDKVNESANSYDQHGRLEYVGSFQATHNIGHIPVVNIYLRYLAQKIEQVFGFRGLPLWKDGKRYAIGLSHDVDRLCATRKPSTSRQRIPRLDTSNCRKELERFRDVMDKEASLGFRSTFFFASVSAYNRYASKFDVRYILNTHELRELYQEIHKRDFEVGLHASYNAYQKTWRFLWERIKLSFVTRSPIRGLRHHYARIGLSFEDTARMHEVAGFEYDSSFFFHDHMAFRNSAALPFYVWNQKLQRPLQVLQLPVFCMDGSLFQYQSLNSDEAFQSLLSRTKMIKLVEGLGVLDWHEDTSHPLHPRYSEWGKCYFRYLEALSADGDVWVTSLKNITNWLDQRRRILTS